MGTPCEREPPGCDAAAAPRLPRKRVTLVISARYGSGFDGLTPGDRRLLGELAGPRDGERTDAPGVWQFPRLVRAAAAAGYAIVIRSDLPPID